MMRHFDDDDRRPLKDGEKLVVNMMMMDSVQRAVAAAFDGSVFDASRHRPGWRVGDAAQEDARTRAYDEMCRRAENAWRSPQRIEQDRERACDAARIDVMTAGDAQRKRDEVWHAMVERARNAWKTA
jgi:hypothetical protein